MQRVFHDSSVLQVASPDYCTEFSSRLKRDIQGPEVSRDARTTHLSVVNAALRFQPLKINKLSYTADCSQETEAALRVGSARGPSRTPAKDCAARARRRRGA